MMNYIIGLALLAAVWLACHHLYKNRNKGCDGCRWREHCTKKDAP
ncbi:MAG: FeoB-associated Cys-rich membrane protein [Phascolarctobacterium sp.]|nr:FeoB-associated Cys-rich membrane protein [Candidatus Phascolarctobacterium equi]